MTLYPAKADLITCIQIDIGDVNCPRQGQLFAGLPALSQKPDFYALRVYAG